MELGEANSVDDRVKNGESLPPAPMTDSEVSSVIMTMKGEQLASDQMNFVKSIMKDRSVTCSQAGSMLEIVKNGLVQRIMAVEALKGKVTDLPRGLPLLLTPLTGPIRHDIASEIGGIKGIMMAQKMDGLKPEELHAVKHAVKKTGVKVFKLSKNVQPMKLEGASRLKPTGFGSPTGYPARQSVADIAEDLVGERPDTPENGFAADHVEKLRRHVLNGQVQEPVYGDLNKLCLALGFGGLPAPPARLVPVAVVHKAAANFLLSPKKRGAGNARTPSKDVLPSAPVFTGNGLPDAAPNNKQEWPAQPGAIESEPPSPEPHQPQSQRAQSKMTEESC